MLKANPHTTLEAKLKRLDTSLGSLGSGLVLLSGGADSGLLAWALAKALGHGALALTFNSPASTGEELSSAASSASFAGIRHMVRDLPLLTLEEFAANVEDRCYFCKRFMFSAAREVADEEGLSHIIDGTNATDPAGHRPGLIAARELGVLSPLMDAGLTRAEVRLLAERFGLPAAKRPPGACLATRIPTGVPVTAELLDLVRRAEAEVRSLGFRLVRVRVLGHKAKVEVGRDEVERLLEEPAAARVRDALAVLGFEEVLLDPGGYGGAS